MTKERVEQVVILIAAVFSVTISLADFFGLLDSMPWLAERIPSLTLLMLGVITGYLILERQRIQGVLDLEHRYSQINAFFNAFRENDHFSEVALIYSLRPYGKLVNERMVEVDRNHVLNFWRDCVRGCKHWFAVDYSKQEESWSSGWGDVSAQGIQQERIHAGAVIRRVFIVDNESQYERLKPVMKTQESIGIEVRWLTKDELLKNEFVSDHIKVLGTLDVAIIDDTWIYRGFVDQARRLTHASGTKERELTDIAKFVFREAFRKGKIPDYSVSEIAKAG
jgi:hypothetical protein